MNSEHIGDEAGRDGGSTATLPHALPCIGCGSDLANIAGENQPDRGIEFTTQGHYGTRVFDPMDGSRLAINVCDECLRRAGFAGMVLRYRDGEVAHWCDPDLPLAAGS